MKRPEDVIPKQLRTKSAVDKLRKMEGAARQRGDLAVWRRCSGILKYIAGNPVMSIADTLGAVRSSVYNWIGHYVGNGLEGLVSDSPPGRPRRLTQEDEEQLIQIIESGPVEAGYSTGIWTGPMIADLIRKRMKVKYHQRHIPRLLHRLGFSVQRPRKRLARADSEAQEYWLRKRFPAIKKKPTNVEES